MSAAETGVSAVATRSELSSAPEINVFIMLLPKPGLPDGCPLPCEGPFYHTSGDFRLKNPTRAGPNWVRRITAIWPCTFEKPHQYAEGFSYVIVNGQIVYENR